MDVAAVVEDELSEGEVEEEAVGEEESAPE